MYTKTTDLQHVEAQRSVLRSEMPNSCLRSGTSLAVLMLMSVLPLAAQSPISDTETLRGITQMSLSVGNTEGSGNIDQSAIVATLKQNGIRVLPDGAYPKLVLSLSSTRTSNRCGSMVTPVTALSVEILFYQLLPVGKRAAAVSTYTSNIVGIAGGFGGSGSMIAELADTDIKTFLKDFRSVNESLASTKAPERNPNLSTMYPFIGSWQGVFTGCSFGGEATRVTYVIHEMPGAPGLFYAKENQTQFNYTYEYGGRIDAKGVLVMAGSGHTLRLMAGKNGQLYGDLTDHHNGCKGVELVPEHD